jgi:AAA+ superfamily predicted ATPase
MSATPSVRERIGDRASGASDSALDLVLMRVRLAVLRRREWLSHLRTVAAPHQAGGGLDHRDRPEDEWEWSERADEVRDINDALQTVERALANQPESGLRRLADLFRLGPPELDLLQTCLAAAIEPSLGVAFASLQHLDACTYPTEALAARLFGYGHRSLWGPGSALAVWHLVSQSDAAPGVPPPLAIDRVIVEWLQGNLGMDARLVGLVQLVEPRAPLPGWPVAQVVRRIRRDVERDLGTRVLLVGPPASGRRTFAAAVAQEFAIRALAVDTSGIADADWPDVYMRAQRLAYLGSLALVWHGSGLHRPWPGHIAPAPLQFVACDVDQSVPPADHLTDSRVDLPAPTIDERRALWQSSVPESRVWPAHELDTLAARYRLAPGDIATVSRRNPASAREAAEFCREITRHGLGELARTLPCPFGWDDLVVTPKVREALEDFAFEARDRTSFWEPSAIRRLFPRGTGLVGLFNGAPGTGKTMAAQVIAAELQLDLVRVDLGSVVSKYIGETAKHLSRIFARAGRMNAVLLFDEADALFSKRTEVKDAHDRYANTDTSYLLQLLEEYDGIVILATNKKQNIDLAFIRRVRYVLDFPRPEAAERLTIWRKLVADLSGHDVLARLDTSLALLATHLELSGAQIKNAVLGAMFSSRRTGDPLAMAHVLVGVERELAKEGRALTTRERERLVHGA